VRRSATWRCNDIRLRTGEQSQPLGGETMPHFQQGFAQQLGAVANAAQLFDIGQKIFIQGDCGSHRILQGGTKCIKYSIK
jgi:hypothetical protein